jgi:hypothetical protein
MAKVELAKCPHCGGDLKNTKISQRKDEKVFVCRSCMEILGVIRE